MDGGEYLRWDLVQQVVLEDWIEQDEQESSYKQNLIKMNDRQLKTRREGALILDMISIERQRIATLNFFFPSLMNFCNKSIIMIIMRLSHQP